MTVDEPTAQQETAPAVPRARTAARRRKGKKNPTAAKVSSGKTKTQGGAAAAQRVVISAEQMPRMSLEQSLRVPRALRDTLAGGPATWPEIANAIGVTPGNPRNKYYLWSAQGYGLVQKEEDRFSLSEIGRKILAPTKPNEDKEALVRAVLTPIVFSRFFTDYNGSPFPAEEHIGNVIEMRYGVPRERIEEAKTLLRENGLYSGILRQEVDGSFVVRLDPSTTGVRQAPTSTQPGENTPISDREATGNVVDFEHMCFVVTPIGEDDSSERKHANLILKSVIEPVAQELGLSARRADQIDRAGLITQQIFECLAKARICVADLSFNNANAFYELGIRHMCKAPTVQLIRKGDRIPFDVSQGRTIKVDLTDVYSVVESIESAKKELRQHLKAALSNEYKGEDNPVNTYLPGIEVKIPK